jgi:diguanylate cyclase (GGDEF)-like protein/PAS domain S-box-containing protein
MKTEPFGYIIKPFDERDLRVAVEIALYKHGMGKKLRESENKFHSLFNNASDSIFLFSPATDDLIIDDLNPAACAMHGYTREELIGKPISLLDDPETRKHIPERAKSLTSGKPLFFEGRHVRQDGSTFPVEISARLIHIQGKPYILATDRDITKRKENEEKLIKAKEEWEKTFDTIPDIVSITDNQYKIVRANKALADRLNVKREDLIGKFCYNIIHNTQEPPSDCPHSRTIADNKEYIDELYEKTLNGYFLLSCTPVLDSLGNFTTSVQVLRDISERKKIEEQLKAISLTDELTGLFNRRGFFTLADKEFKLADRHKKRMSLIYLDLDGLKAINDKLGHEAGDHALVDSANILRKSFRESDIMGRMGGDEFAVLITDGSEADIEKIAVAHVKQNLKIHNEQAGRSYALLLSMGFAHYDPGSPCTISELIKQADSSMYEDKKRHNPIII